MNSKSLVSIPKSKYQDYIHLSRYARWLEKEKRRETWEETVRRYVNFFHDKFEKEGYTNPKITNVLIEIEKAIFNHEVMPSMRCLMSAGKALKRDNVAGYNCGFLIMNRTRAFDELMYALLCGTGMGFSVERQFINQLPEITEEFFETDTVIQVRDSKLGWANAYRELIAMLYVGRIPSWDVSKVRPAGARLKTFGGRASGPEPLVELFKFTIKKFKGAAGRKLTSIEVHDIVCKIADVVIVGGVRRAALISLSNLSDSRMRAAKTGQWWIENPQRALANNSVCYTERPEISVFLKEWITLIESRSGERGIFNRSAAQKKALSLGEDKRDPNQDFGCNPCSEILLRDRQFCNLTEVVIRQDDTLDSLKEKVRIAAIVGTIQATLTDFRYLSKKWKENTEEEALLGVSLTGIMDHPYMSGKTLPHKFKRSSLKDVLEELKEIVIKTNKTWAKILKINPSAATTCVKPSGTVSQLVDAASGIHPRYSKYYVRTVRGDRKDPLSRFLKDSGVPCENEIRKPDATYVFSFPISSPNRSVLRDDRGAIEQLELWKLYADHWAEHKPSITIYVKDEEWLEVVAWVFKRFDSISGVSFLPHSDHIYQQAPYQEIDASEFKKLNKEFPKNIDWEKLREYEKEDNTTGTQELACSAGSCEII